jgi:hypothetical protein
MALKLRLLVPLAVAATAALGTASAAAAGPVQDPLPIGPDQYFNAQVNGASVNAAITVVCPGPVGKGHPVAGQSVEAFLVVPPVTSVLGYTGTAAHSIDAYFPGVPPIVNPPVVLSGYFAKYAIPTTLTLPCGGTGTVVFAPTPTSPTARSFTVTVRFLNIAG